MKQAPAGYCICEKQHRAGSNQNRANTTWWNSPVLGDGIYGCRWITDLVSEKHATPYFLPRSNVTFKSKGALGWYDMLYSLWEDPQGWLEEYHMRSISETVNSMVKCRFGAPLRKRLESRKETETRL